MAIDERCEVAVTTRARRRLGRMSLVALGLGGLLLAATGCDKGPGQLLLLGMPPPADDRAISTHRLWIGTWIAAFCVGFLVWGLILWVALRYRRRGNVVPRQSRYNLPAEIMYTLVPFVILGVLFYYTVITQTAVLRHEPAPQHEIDVVGQKWSWTFNYREANDPAVGNDVYEAGTINHSPDLYLPVNETVRFNLSSPDVIHSFWVPAFAFKLDVVPGRHNFFDVTPNHIGVFRGKCAELCGTYHSAMLFNVHIVSRAEYDSYLKGLAARGNIGSAMGGQNTTTIETGTLGETTGHGTGGGTGSRQNQEGGQ